VGGSTEKNRLNDNATLRTSRHLDEPLAGDQILKQHRTLAAFQDPSR